MALQVVRGIRQRSLDRDRAAIAKAQIAALIRATGGGSQFHSELLAAVDRHTTQSDHWDFDMSNPVQEASVLRLIRTEAERPFLSLAIWEQILLNTDRSTSAVLLSRADLAKAVGTVPERVSSVMTEFVRWNVLRRLKNGNIVVFVLNPWVRTRLPGAAGEDARKAAGPVLRVVEPVS